MEASAEKSKKKKNSDLYLIARYLDVLFPLLQNEPSATQQVIKGLLQSPKKKVLPSMALGRILRRKYPSPCLPKNTGEASIFQT